MNQNIVKSKLAPHNKNVLWFDTNNNTLKIYDNGWKSVQKEVVREILNENIESTLITKDDILNSSGTIKSEILPSYVDDILEYDNLNSFPAEGETGKIYLAKDSGWSYRWGGSKYTIVSTGSDVIATNYETFERLRTTASLQPGKLYRYKFKTKYRENGKDYDDTEEYTIYVRAVANNTVDERIIIHQHPSWEVRYIPKQGSMDVEWSRADDMGQIIYLKDEHGNSAGFDWKNIKMSMYKHLTTLGEVVWIGTKESICDSLYVEETKQFKLFYDDTKLYNITIEHEFGKLPNSHIEYTGGNRCEMLKIGLKNSYLKGYLCSVNAVDSYAYIYDGCDVKHIERSIIELDNTKANEIQGCEGSLSESTFSNIKHIYADFQTCELEEIYNSGVHRQYSFYRAHFGNFSKSDSGTWTFGDLKISNTAGKTYSTGKHRTVKFSRNVDFTIEQRYNFADFKNCTELFIFGYANSTTDDAYIAAVDGVTKTETQYVFPKGDTPQLVVHTIRVDGSESHTIRFGGAQVCAIVGIYSSKGRNHNLHGRINLLSSAIDSSCYISANSRVMYPLKVYNAVGKDYQRLYRTFTTDEGVFYTRGGNSIVGYSVSALQKKDGAYYISFRDEEYSFYLDYAELWEYLHPCMKEFFSETKGVITHRLVDPYTLVEICEDKNAIVELIGENSTGASESEVNPINPGFIFGRRYGKTLKSNPKGTATEIFNINNPTIRTKTYTNDYGDSYYIYYTFITSKDNYPDHDINENQYLRIELDDRNGNMISYDLKLFRDIKICPHDESNQIVGFSHSFVQKIKAVEELSHLEYWYVTTEHNDGIIYMQDDTNHLLCWRGNRVISYPKKIKISTYSSGYISTEWRDMTTGMLPMTYSISLGNSNVPDSDTVYKAIPVPDWNISNGRDMIQNRTHYLKNTKYVGKSFKLLWRGTMTTYPERNCQDIDGTSYSGKTFWYADDYNNMWSSLLEEGKVYRIGISTDPYHEEFYPNPNPGCYPFYIITGKLEKIIHPSTGKEKLCLGNLSNTLILKYGLYYNRPIVPGLDSGEPFILQSVEDGGDPFFCLMGTYSLSSEMDMCDDGYDIWCSVVVEEVTDYDIEYEYKTLDNGYLNLDSEVSETSDNPVTSAAVYRALQNKTIDTYTKEEIDNLITTSITSTLNTEI